MAEGIKKGVRVDIIGKNLKGTIAYIGTTMFAPGKWIGVVLDVPKGKNDGTVQGKRYFDCSENYGVFVRQQHVAVISDESSNQQPTSGLKTPRSVSKGKRQSIGMKVSASESRLARTSSPSQLPTPSSQPQLSRLSGLPTPSSVDKAKRSSPQTAKKPTPQPPPPEPDHGDTTEVVTVVQQPSEQQNPLASISALASGVSMAEVESLKAQVKDWKDKFETIRMKRQADRDKLKDLEKSKLQVQQLMEFKNRMSEQNQDLMKQLRDAKKEAKEAVESKDRYTEEMADVHETIEMATLDKEMAEEKVETLQHEVDGLNEKLEELQTDMEIMKAEIEDKGTDGAASTYQLKQLEEQNARLKEALLRMRDLSTAEKSEHQSVEKLMEKKTKELNDTLRKNEKIAEELEKAESTIDELKEQVDAALVAEEMVEELTDKNLQLEEKLTDFEEQIHDLETMNEMNEELQENARENEMELREEVDLARSKMREAERKREAANETVNDYQDTIKKFRKLVQELQEANEDLRQQQSGDEKPAETETVAPSPFNYQIKMVETKFRHLNFMLENLPSEEEVSAAPTTVSPLHQPLSPTRSYKWQSKAHAEATARSIDLDLRKLDAQQANDHVQYLSMFMPSLFSKRGGDGDCVQVILLVQRISKKAEILARHVSDRFELTAQVDQANDLRGVRGEQLTFASGLVCTLQQLQTLMDRYEMSLAHCSVELFQKVGTLSSEMTPHERVLDALSESLRRDTLDETSNTDQLMKAVEFFKHVYNVHVGKEPFVDCWKFMDEYVKQSNVMLQSIHINSRRLKSLLKTGQETSDVAILLRDLETASSDIKQFCKKLRRRMPQAPDVSSGRLRLEELPMLKFGKDIESRIQDSEHNLFNIYSVVSAAMQQCSISSGTDNSPMPYHEMQEIFGKSCKSVFTSGESGYNAVRVAIGNVMATMNSLVTALQEGEFDTSERRKKTTPPVEKRAVAIKAEITDSEGLASKLGDKDTVIQELRKSLKLKAAEIGELKIKIGMLERKLNKSGKVEEEHVSRLQQENDNLKEELKKKEREYDETLDTLQHDIDTLEDEKSELKQRLIAQSKRSYTDIKGSPGMASPSAKSNIASILAGAATAQGVTPGTQIVVEDSPLMKEQINALQIALRAKRAENYRLLGKALHDRMKKISPLNVPNKGKMDPRDKSKAEIRKFHLNLTKLKEHIVSVACPKVVDITQSKSGTAPVGSKSPSQQLVHEQLRLQIAREKIAELQIKACQLMAQKNVVKREFVSFPTTQFTKTLDSSNAVLVGNLSLPGISPEKSGFGRFQPATGGGNLLLEPEELLQLHNRVIGSYVMQ